MATGRRPHILGHAELTSPWFSNQWRLLADTGEIARIVRLGRLYASAVTLADGDQWLIEPCGTGEVRVVEQDLGETARITRRSWLGRRWEIVGRNFLYDLVSLPTPRRWTIGLGGAVITDLKGSLISYNHVDIDAQLNMPVEAILLAWHVVARPWEAIAAPRGLVPAARPATQRRTAPLTSPTMSTTRRTTEEPT